MMENKQLIDGYNLNVSRVEVLLRITRVCNQGCLFCSVELDSYSFSPIDEIFRTIDSMKHSHPGKIIEFVLTGGEPTLHPDFITIIEYLYNKGCYIRVQTNAVYFGNKNNFDKISKYLDKIDFFISFHSHIEKIYDILTQSTGQYKIAIQGIKNIIGTSHTELNIVINTLNLPYLQQYFSFVGKIFGSDKNFYINISCLTNIAKYSYGSSLLVPMTNIVKKINNSQDIIRYYNINIMPSFGGPADLPFCIGKSVFYFSGKGYKYDEHMPDRFKNESCESCDKKDLCSGILKRYAEKYGIDEFKPINHA